MQPTNNKINKKKVNKKKRGKLFLGIISCWLKLSRAESFYLQNFLISYVPTNENETFSLHFVSDF